jgi:chemotaxis protein methyltransferase CheR
VLFFTHNLVTDGVFNEFQLILCRNVLIYFDVGLQERVLRLFSDSLDMSGFMVLGESEGISINNGEKYFIVYDKSYKIYRKNTHLQISSQNAIIAT